MPCFKTQLTLFFIVAFGFIAFPQAQKFIRQAERTSNLNEKINLYNQAISVDVNNLDAYFQRAIVKNELGDFYGAIADYSKVILIKPDADTYYNRGNSRFCLNDFDSAIVDYQNALSLNPTFYEAFYSLGCCKFELGNYTEALTYFDEVLNAFPYDGNAYLKRAQCYDALKQFKAAQLNFTLATKFNQDADTYYARGLFFMNINYYKDAKKDFNKVILEDKNNTSAYFYRATASLFLGEFDKAITDYTVTTNTDALDFDALLGLAIAHLKTNDTVKAKQYFSKASNIISPNLPISNINQLNESYWFVKQFYFLNQVFNSLTAL